MQSIETGRLEAWPRCPEAAEYFTTLFRAFAAHNPPIAAIADRFLDRAAVPMMNIVDHWVVPRTASLETELRSIGLEPTVTADGDPTWEHPAARLPRIRMDDEARSVRLAIAVEDLQPFVEANDLPASGQLGDPGSGYEEIRVPLQAGELAVVARRGYRGFRPGTCTAADARALARVRAVLRARPRSQTGPGAADEASGLLRSLAEDIETDRLVDEFFAAERDHYMGRNLASRVQSARQQEIGIGWANHDHHTYRSSRVGFRALIELWLQLGFEAREKFYAGAEAGWGAQVLEHPVSRVVLFCDVDMAPEELSIDYSRTDLPPLTSLGTIGLWCSLHTESIGAAGLHHLEAEFDFARARALMERDGIRVMPPFTDMPVLKQAFTEAETWPVDPDRAARLCDQGLITAEQRDRFVSHGAPGSHLEILQRWEGFKGFNKTGIDAIIRDTDARAAARS